MSYEPETHVLARQLVTHYSRRYLKRFGGLMDQDLLESAALYGAFQAVDTYDPERGTSLHSHIYNSIRWEVSKMKRQIDPMSRTMRDKIRREGLESISICTLPALLFSELFIYDEDRPEELVVDPSPGPEELALDRVAQASFFQFLDQHFGTREVEIIRLRYWLEWSQSEIARHFGIYQSVVSDTERRVLKRLRPLLVEHGWTTDDGAWI